MSATEAAVTTEAQRVINDLMTERQLQDNVIELCKRLNLLIYHTYDSRRSEPGFPDLVIVGKRMILYVELKRQVGKLSKEQKAWREAIENTADRRRPFTGHCYYLWRPHEWNNGEIEDTLTELAR